MSNNRLSFLMVPVCAALLAIGCTNTNGPGATSSAAPQKAPPPVANRSGPPPSAKSTYTAAPPVGDIAQYEKMQAVIETEHGNIFIEFYPKEAPKTVASFVKLAQDGFYDGLTFHRVIQGFMAQGGDPTGTGQGGPGYNLPAEFNAHKHIRGAVAMARTPDPNSAGSQFYICFEPQPSLDNQYTVFGQVTKGMETVDQIKQGDHMLKVRIEPKGGGAVVPASPAASSPGAAPASPGGAPASPAASSPGTAPASPAASSPGAAPASPAASSPGADKGSPPAL